MLNPTSDHPGTAHGQTPEFARCTLCDLLYHRMQPWLIPLDQHPFIDRMRNSPAVIDRWMTQQMLIQRAYNDQVAARPTGSPTSLNIVQDLCRTRLAGIVQTRVENDRLASETACLATCKFIAMMNACAKNCSSALLGLWYILEQFEPSRMCTRCPIRCASIFSNASDSATDSSPCWLREMENDSIDIPHRLLIVDTARESARALGDILDELDQVSN